MKTKRSRLGVLGLLSALVVVGCASISVSVDYDPEADFSGFRSYGWLPEPEATGDPRTDSPLLQQRVRTAVEAELAARGFVASTDPQMRVGYHLSTEQKLDVRVMNAHYGYGHGAWQRGDAVTQVSQYDQGTLVIDIVDAGRDALVWRGVGQARLRSQTTPEQSTERIRQAVSQILARFPPGAGG